MIQSRFGIFKEYFVPALVLLVLSLIFFNSTQTQFPAHIHAWTQSDRYAIAVGFMENGYDFFHPSTLNLKPRYEAAIPVTDPQGITSVDFPVIEYIAALLMGVYGQPAPWIFRSLMLLISLGGLIFWFRFMREVGVSYWLSLFGLLLAFSAPVYTYYLNGFIPSTSAIAMSMTALYFFVRFLQHEKKTSIIVALIFLTLAALIRKPFVMGVLAMAAAFVVVYWREKSKLEYVLAGFLAVFTIVGFYHIYNKYLSFTYGSLFISKLMPAKSFEEAIQLIQLTWDNWKFSYFSLPGWIGIGLAFLMVLLKSPSDKKLKLLKTFGILCLFAALLYLIVMARQFPAHDYYFLDSFFLPLLIFLTLGLFFLSGIEKTRQWLVILTVIVLNSWMLRQSYAIQRERNTYKSWDRTEITRRSFEGSAKLLHEAGVPPEARLLVLDAYTTNIPLLMLDRKGYTVINTSRENLEKALHWDYDFIAIQNRFLASDVLRNYPEIASKMNPIANNGRIGIYKKAFSDTLLTYNQLVKVEIQNTLIQHKLNDLILKKDSTTDCLEFQDAFLPLADTMFSVLEDELVVYFDARISSANLPKKLFLVMDVSSKDGFKHYESFNLKPFFEADSTFARPALMMQIPSEDRQEIKLKLYLWNAEEQYLCIENIDFKLVTYRNKFSQYLNDYEEY